MKWEYLVMTLLESEAGDTTKRAYKEGLLNLNILGKLSWELVSINNRLAYFKRPSPEWVEEQKELPSRRGGA